MLNITKTTENNALTVALEGRLDTTTAPELEAELKAALPGVSSLTIDMSKLSTSLPPACACFCLPRRS